PQSMLHVLVRLHALNAQPMLSG
ncbi:hypothetical protein D018_2712B, partial [Vibrio parahaemolyticus VP2007-007]